MENLFIEGSSLEPTLLERIRIHLSEMENLSEMDDEHIHGWWEDLNNDFNFDEISSTTIEEYETVASIGDYIQS